VVLLSAIRTVFYTEACFGNRAIAYNFASMPLLLLNVSNIKYVYLLALLFAISPELNSRFSLVEWVRVIPIREFIFMTKGTLKFKQVCFHCLIAKNIKLFSQLQN